MDSGINVFAVGNSLGGSASNPCLAHYPSSHFSEGHGKTKKSPVMSPLVSSSSGASGMVSAVSPQKLEDSARRHIASELLQTERNFVEILSLIVSVSLLYVSGGGEGVEGM